MKDIYNNNKL